MHSLFLIPLLVAAVFGLTGCASTQQASSSSMNQGASAGAVSDESNVAVMFVHGMACPQCSYNVDLQLKRVPGVERVRVNMAVGRVDAWLSTSAPPTREQLTRAIEQTTFTLVSLRMPGESAVVQ